MTTTVGTARPPAVAGSFYPGSAAALAAAVDGLLARAAAGLPEPSPGVLRGIVVPHAGYAYSGPVAATAYALARRAAAPRRLVVIGVSHFIPLQGLAVSAVDAWRTPLGAVPVDEAARAALLAAGAVADDRCHRHEHSIEVQLPFLQRCFPGVPVVPVAVGEGDPVASAGRLDAALAPGALLVVSTDLSHYHDDETARRRDERTAAAVLALDIEQLGSDDACGVHPLRAAMAWARHHDGRIELLDLRNSADTAGDPSRVVGYGAFAITVAP